jgi:prolyl oligopeptidase
VSIFENEKYVLTPQGARILALPLQSEVNAMVEGRILVTVDKPWTADGRDFSAGTLVSLDFKQVLADPQRLTPTLVYKPGPREVLNNDPEDGELDVVATHDRIVVTTLDNVNGRAFIYTPVADGMWNRQPLTLPDHATIDVRSTDHASSNAFIDVRGFLAPTQLYLVNTDTKSLTLVKSEVSKFDRSAEVVEQHEATSKDGTQIPYFIVHAKNMRLDSANPTILTAYGGFTYSNRPYYDGTLGKLWLERGGAFVLANIRGGGEFGPAWHDAGLKTHRQRIYDDFAAVGRDLIARKITAPRHLGIIGGSNGGLLMGVEVTQHPELWNAAFIEVPLLDMLRYEKIAAGASWTGEYGSVSVPAERAFLAKISPYNNLRAGVKYPKVFLETSSKDDRVGPQHARKFAAKLAAMHVPYYFYESTEGGHSSMAANIDEQALNSALQYTYFSEQLH